MKVICVSTTLRKNSVSEDGKNSAGTLDDVTSY
jgi:hypothetical protein